MKKLIKIFMVTIFIYIFSYNNIYANIKTYEIFIENKQVLLQNLTNSHKKIKKLNKWEIFIQKIDILIKENIRNTKKLVSIYNNISKIKNSPSYKNIKSENIILILDYIQYKVWYILYMNDSVAKIRPNPNIE